PRRPMRRVLQRLTSSPRLRRGLLALLGTGAVVMLAFVAWPVPPGLLDPDGALSVRVLDRDGHLLREIPSRRASRSISLPADAPVPAALRDAFIASEDRRFEWHPGVDPLAVLRAAGTNLRAGRVVSGASTLTQQLARLLVPRHRTIAGKAQEALWALRLTAHLSREDILRAYLDRVALGHDVVGAEAAAQAYFGRPARTLSVGQAALLAAIARSPARVDPWRDPEAARRAMREVLGRMRRAGRLDAELERVAAAADLDLVPPARAFGAPHLVVDLAGKLETLGLGRAVEVRTTLDPALQRDVERSVRSELAADPRLGQAAVLVLDNLTGEVLAYVGSADFLDTAREGQNDGVRARRQPGSALKPFAYGLALASGWTPASVLSDVDLEVGTAGGAWLPRNYDRRQHGPVRLRAALANSYNVPAVELTETLGPERVLDVLRQAGFASLEDSAEHYGAGLVLGNGDVSLWELGRAYRGLARDGVVEPLRLVRAATGSRGERLEVKPELAPRRFLPPDAVALLTDLLSDEGARAPAFGLDNALRLPFSVAAKTGTSRAYVDNWTVGFTHERTVAVWVGNFDGRPMQRVSGITGAGPLFARVMRRAMAGIRQMPLVDRARFEHVRICPLSGHRATEACPGSYEEVFLPGSAPAEPCAMHRLADGRPVLALDARYAGWAERERLEVAPAAGGGDAMGFLTPRDGDEFLLEASIPAASQSIPVRVRGQGELRVDGEVVPLDALGRTRVVLAAGVHRLELRSRQGSGPSPAVQIRVRGGDASPAPRR
ncbi:MAG TPA: penicillin-binding protein 1C, partial [Myxococcaceae bacterium]|nr:penicillin-binding protein 1C [Myxococcaceae bacterium]